MRKRRGELRHALHSEVGHVPPPAQLRDAQPRAEPEPEPEPGRSSSIEDPKARAYEFAQLSSDAELASLEPEWRELFARSGTRNPFAHPSWVRTWFEHFASKKEQRVVIAARLDGQLMAVAPLASRSHGPSRLHARSLELIGGGAARADRLTEMTEILVAPEGRRKTLRALLHHLMLDSPTAWDWLVVTLPPVQGWYEDEWLPAAWSRRGARVIHRATLPFVVLPLPGTWEELPLKPNMREAIRRSKNRLASGASQPEVVFAAGEATVAAIARLQALHRHRATLTGHRAHENYFASDAMDRFTRDAANALAAAGNATVVELDIGGSVIAARLVLHANDAVFYSVSGFDPDHWRLGAPTYLLAASLRQAIAQGDKLANLSMMPDSAKLRWSEQLELHNEFVVVAPTRRSQRMFAAYWHARTIRMLRRRAAASNDAA